MKNNDIRAGLVAFSVILVTLAPAASAAPGGGDARDGCARAAMHYQQINLSSGVYSERAVAVAPLTLRIPAGVDPASYGDCLAREGFEPAAPAVAYVERSRACRDEAAAPAVVRLADGSRPRLTGGLDTNAWRACVDGALEVEATLPE